MDHVVRQVLTSQSHNRLSQHNTVTDALSLVSQLHTDADALLTCDIHAHYTSTHSVTVTCCVCDIAGVDLFHRLLVSSLHQTAININNIYILAALSIVAAIDKLLGS